MFQLACGAIALTFTVYFAAIVVPAVLQDRDVFGAFAAGFVNPYASGYAADAILCWVTLLIWVLHDIRCHHIRHGWVCVVLGLVPGVAVGFAIYLILRHRQLGQASQAAAL